MEVINTFINKKYCFVKYLFIFEVQTKATMIKRAKVFFLFLFVFWGEVFPQTLSHEVMVPVAGLANTSSFEYTQTIGETAVEIISGSGFELTQGFQQPSIEAIMQEDNIGNGVEAYPNPAIDYIKVKLFGNVAREFRIDLINITGTIVKTSKVKFITNYNHVHRIDVNNLLRGLYYVRIISMDGVFNRSFKIEKM